MADDNRRDYWAAFAIGAIVGVGATLLLTPDKPTPARRILYDIEPALERARKGTRKAARRGMKSARKAYRRFR
ncbi:MAG TPA: YtxH domain-containing protein [Longimicrobiales bacterium]